MSEPLCWHELRRHLGLDERVASAEELEARLSAANPEAQRCALPTPLSGITRQAPGPGQHGDRACVLGVLGGEA